MSEATRFVTANGGAVNRGKRVSRKRAKELFAVIKLTIALAGVRKEDN